MKAKRKIQAACAYRGISQASLADKIGMSRQTFSARLKSGKFTLEEWEMMAKALGAKFEAGFIFEDGGRI